MIKLTAPGWNDTVRRDLSRILAAGANQGLPVVFDFDNTLVCGDIGEATLALLVRDGILRPENLPPGAGPSFRLPNGKEVSPTSVADLTEYYEALLDPTVHGPLDPTPLASGYVWAAEAMHGLPLPEVVRATEAVWALSRDGENPRISTPGGGAYPVPFFYPEMLELMAELIRLHFDLWIVSASNVWSVRWTVNHVLNPLLKARGASEGISAEQVVGVAILLARDDGSLCKDAVLVREFPAYAAMQPEALAAYRLSRWLQYPVPTYSGKVGAIWDLIGRPPYLACGDSPGDLPMLSFSQHRLWVHRIDKPRYFEAMQQVRRSTSGPWLIQPARTRSEPAFLPGTP